MSRKIIKPSPISGFPEHSPSIRAIELSWIDALRGIFESYGFCNIETPSVEALDIIAAKGEVDKEIYVLERLHKQDGDKEARSGLRFDQTVPLARYTAQHFSELVFPFKRWQIQKVWRGERPQAGRFREFYQADIDVIGVDNLSISFDAELVSIMHNSLTSLPFMPKFTVHISNRKILIGLCEALEIKDAPAVLRTLDKGQKTGIQQIDDLSWYGIEPLNDTMEAGINELSSVVGGLSNFSNVSVDLSIVRGLDYYTGTVCEMFLDDNPEFGSVCSGGRYDDLASSYINKKLPGVGFSIGLSRLFDYVKSTGSLEDAKRTSPADVLVVIPNKDLEALANETADTLRSRGIKTELFHAPQKIGKQIAYAQKKGIPYVWFPPFEDGGAHEVKAMKTGNQSEVSPDEWSVT